MRRYAEFKRRNDPLNLWLNLHPSRMEGFKIIAEACGGLSWQTPQKWATSQQVPDRYVPDVSRVTGIPHEHLSPNAARLIVAEMSARMTKAENAIKIIWNNAGENA
jgi:hypothetical protein